VIVASVHGLFHKIPYRSEFQGSTSPLHPVFEYLRPLDYAWAPPPSPRTTPSLPSPTLSAVANTEVRAKGVPPICSLSLESLRLFFQSYRGVRARLPLSSYCKTSWSSPVSLLLQGKKVRLLFQKRRTRRPLVNLRVSALPYYGPGFYVRKICVLIQGCTSGLHRPVLGMLTFPAVWRLSLGSFEVSLLRDLLRSTLLNSPFCIFDRRHLCLFPLDPLLARLATSMSLWWCSPLP